MARRTIGELGTSARSLALYQAASGEALGKVFDCLQVEDVSRGLIFGIMLQALKVITH